MAGADVHASTISFLISSQEFRKRGTPIFIPPKVVIRNLSRTDLPGPHRVVYRDKGDEKDIKYYFRFIPFIIFIPVNSLLLSSSWKG